uniref:Putative secreted protein n=1 Tax=Phlebotomus kandelakii TaxID=1109342 RepID=A0A6B2ECR3_9DIPT
MMKYVLGLLLIVSVVTSQLTDNGEESSGKAKIRRPRSILGFFQSIFTIHQLHQAQKTDTSYALARIYDVLKNSFSDTATPKPVVAVEQVTSEPNATTTTTTERTKISRREFGRILGRNFRGLQKVYQLELLDAQEQSKRTIQEYKVQLGNSLAPFVYNLQTDNTIN